MLDDPRLKVGCQRCEKLPDPLPDKGTLYLAPPIIQTTDALREQLDRMGLPYEEVHQSVFAVPFTRPELERICDDGICEVSQLELRDTKSLILADGEELSMHHLTRMHPLESVVARLRGEWLIDLLREQRLYSHFHPIVHTQEPQRIFAYECLARGRDKEGGPVFPGTMFDIAISADLLFNLDRACRLSAIRGCVEYGIESNVFVNFTPGTIYNPKHCLKTTLRAVEAAGLSPSQVVFEVVESEEITDPDHLLNILNYYREHGFRVALDDLGSGFSSLNLLTRLRPDFVKLDMELVRNVDKDEFKSVITTKLLSMARNLGVQTIAEGVETVEEWNWLREQGADYVQGFLFARPAAPPPGVVVPQGG